MTFAGLARQVVLLSFVGSVSTQSIAANLFNDGQAALTSDRRASRVGDILTVLIYEESSATNSAGTSANKDFAVKGQVSSLKGKPLGVSGQIGDDYAGKGRIDRAGRVIAQISVTVDDVLANGDLMVAGAQAINVNGEKTKIRLKGRVRSTDIGDTNTVLSTRLADANIDYDGDGYVSDHAKPGLVPRFLNWLGIW